MLCETDRVQRRVNERSQQLLQEAKLPPRMEMWTKTAAQASAQKKPARDPDLTFRPNVNHHIPDYDRLYAQFTAALQKRKLMRASTPYVPDTLPANYDDSAKPFQFHECNNLNRVIDDIARDEEILPETRWPFMSTRKKVNPTPPPDMDGTPAVPAKTNKTTELRKHTVRKSLEISRIEESKNLEEEKKRKEKSKVHLCLFLFTEYHAGNGAQACSCSCYR